MYFFAGWGEVGSLKSKKPGVDTLQTNNKILFFSAILLAVLMVNLEYSGIIIIIPQITRLLHLTVSQIELSASLFLFTFTILIVVSGRLGDIFGCRLVLIIGLIIFAVASLVAGFAVGIS